MYYKWEWETFFNKRKNVASQRRFELKRIYVEALRAALLLFNKQEQQIVVSRLSKHLTVETTYLHIAMATSCTHLCVTASQVRAILYDKEKSTIVR